MLGKGVFKDPCDRILQGTVLNPIGLRPFLMQAEVMRTLTELEVRMKKAYTPGQPCAGEKLSFSLDVRVKERGVEDSSNVLYLEDEDSR